MMKNVRRDRSPTRVMVTNEMKVDYWFAPKHDLEIRGSEITESPAHSCNWAEEEKRGLALRFPRFERWRPEKKPEQATSVREIANMFLAQNEVKVADG